MKEQYLTSTILTLASISDTKESFRIYFSLFHLYMSCNGSSKTLSVLLIHIVFLEIENSHKILIFVEPQLDVKVCLRQLSNSVNASLNSTLCYTIAVVMKKLVVLHYLQQAALLHHVVEPQKLQFQNASVGLCNLQIMQYVFS